MCLSRITKEFKEPQMMQFYKVMWRLRRKGQPNLYYFHWRDRCDPVEKGKIKLASVGMLETNPGFDTCAPRGRRYRAGFHGYTNLRQAASRLCRSRARRRWNYRESAHGKLYRVVVLCEGPVRTLGVQGGKRVTVADTMRILKEISLTQLFPRKGKKK